MSRAHSPLGPTLALDLRVQAKSGLYAVGVGVAIALGMAARLLIGPDHAAAGIPAMYLFALSGTTLFFGASLVLLEKSQGVLMALRVTPLAQRAYLFSKLLTLLGFTIIEALIFHAIGFWGAPFDPAPLIVGTVALGLTNTLIGMGMVASQDSVLSFLIPGGLIVGLLQTLPVIEVVGLTLGPLHWVIPAEPAFMLLRASTTSLSTGEWAFAIAGTLFWLFAAGAWTLRRFATHIALGGDR